MCWYDNKVEFQFKGIFFDRPIPFFFSDGFSELINIISIQMSEFFVNCIAVHKKMNVFGIARIITMLQKMLFSINFLFGLSF